MNVKSVVENKEKYEVELVVELTPEEFEAGVEKAYRKSRGSIAVPGFRKGKAPRKIIEGMYGHSVFYEEAVSQLYPDACNAAIEEKGLDSVAPPQVEILTLGKEEGFSFKATVTIRPKVTLKQYKGLEAEKVLPTVTEEAVDKELKQYVDRAIQMVTVEREAKMGDMAVIDYKGFMDGKAFSGGSAEGHELVLGSGLFIPGFEEQVVGMKAGDEKSIDLTFPEEYHAEDLAGKPVTFQVKCQEVKERQAPELDDEFAKDVSEFDTMAEFREDLKRKVIERNMKASDDQFRKKLLEMISDQVDIELPEAMVEARVDSLMENYANRLSAQGITMDMYMQYMRTTEEQIRESLRTTAVSQIKEELALEYIVDQEKIVVTDQDVEDDVRMIISKMDVSYETISQNLNFKVLKADMARDQAIAVLVSSAKPKLVADVDNGEPKVTTITKEEVEAEAEEKKTTRKPRAKKTETAEGEKKADAAEGAEKPKKTTRKKKEEAEKVEE